MAFILKLLLFYLFCTNSLTGEPPEDAGQSKESGDNAETEVKALEETDNSSKDDLFKNLEDDKGEEESATNKTTTEDAKNVTESIESIVLPEVGSAAKEHSSSLAIFFLLFILILSIFLIHLLLKVKFHYLPESLAMGKKNTLVKCALEPNTFQFFWELWWV